MYEPSVNDWQDYTSWVDATNAELYPNYRKPRTDSYALADRLETEVLGQGTWNAATGNLIEIIEQLRGQR